MNYVPFGENFSTRHIGPRNNEIEEMLKEIGVSSLKELIDQTVPDNIMLKKEPVLDPPLTESELILEMKRLASLNKPFKNYIGMGYNETITPSVIKRNILENPGWYTQYTPYQAEISQGRLEALLNFQTMVSDLTGMELANASLLDEGTAAAEAMSMFWGLRKGDRKNSSKLIISDNLFPQTIDVVKTRSKPLGIQNEIVDNDNILLSEDVFAVLVQFPGKNGSLSNYEQIFLEAKEKGIYIIVAADLMSLTLLKPPGEMGADCVVGSTQRFGVPLGFGGPHAAYFATKEQYKRSIPGRIIGVSVDSKGRRALRMALQTREQHIKRERATSNICTAQVLLAIMASMYAVYHGPEGIRRIATEINLLAVKLADGLKKLGFDLSSESFFDTVSVQLSDEKKTELMRQAEQENVNLNYFIEGEVSISIGETSDDEDIENLLAIFQKIKTDDSQITVGPGESIPLELKRVSNYLSHEVFSDHHSETDMMRYIKSLERKDLSLTTSMIPLGSCTMKLNAASELFALSYEEFSNLHPFAPLNQAEGYLEMFNNLERELGEITGLPGVSLQPNSGAQGEYTGLLVIKAYHEARGEGNRNIVIIPSSAHGTNPASAVLAGNRVVIVKCDDNGNIDKNDLIEKAELYKEDLCALMVTYPSTHGVFEKSIIDITDIIHQNGGLVYMDGANLNAQLGLTNPAIIGADVCHLNLHKTFAIPHGGGGPGVGPIAVTEKLLPYLPGHPIVNMNRPESISAVSSAPWGSASILTISYAYIRMMGLDGLKRASEIAILNANYIRAKLQDKFEVLYKGERGFVAHELIFDTREFKKTANVEVEDIAKRLMDYGYHAPTVSFPVPGTLMVEPTESESKKELDRFCSVMESIFSEIKEIENGSADPADNVLKNAPHTLSDIIGEWNHSYSVKKAIAPAEWIKENKFWPTVGRVDNAYGDRNLVCSCLPIEEYLEEV
jgi:glycine dehydrogenase